MADNVAITAGSGTVIGADSCTVNSVANVLVQLGKLGYGANDSFTYVDSTHGMPANVVQINGVTPLMGNGVSGTGAQRVTLASDSTGQVALAAGSAVAQPDPAATTGTISVVDAGTSAVTNSLGQSIITGTPTATSFITATISGESTIRIQLSGTTFNGTIVFEESIDGGTTYRAASVAAPNVVGIVSSATFTGVASTQVFRVDIAAKTQYRVRCSARSAGTLAVTMQPGYGGIDVSMPGGVALIATEVHLGEIGGNSAIIAVNPTISTSVYVSGYVLGGIQTLTNAMRKSGGTGLLQSAFIRDASKQNASIDILIYNQNPANGTYTDHAAFAHNATDDAFLIRKITIAASDWTTCDTFAVADLDALSKVVQASGSANLYAIAIVRGTPTYAALALTFSYGFMRD